MAMNLPKPQGRGIVKALGQSGTTGNFAKIQAAKGRGAAIAALQNKLAKKRKQPIPFLPSKPGYTPGSPADIAMEQKTGIKPGSAMDKKMEAGMKAHEAKRLKMMKGKKSMPWSSQNKGMK